MDDIAPELWSRINRLIDSGNASSPALRSMPKTYKTGTKYAMLAGENVSRALRTVLTEDALPDGRLYYNIAQRTVRPALEMLYEQIADAGESVQLTVNEAAGIGIKAIRPELNDSRIVGIIDRLTEAEKMSDIEWMLNSPIVNFAQAVLDDTVKVNADFHYNAGLKPRIVRTAAGKVCDWCASLAGSYSYPITDDDFIYENIYRRHENCSCIVEYYPGTGGKQNVWNKRWS